MLRGGCKRSFGPREQRSLKSLLHRCNPILHRCKSSFGWCKRLFGDLCSLGPKDLLHPPLSTFGKFPFSVSFPGPQLPNPWLDKTKETQNTKEGRSGQFTRISLAILRLRCRGTLSGPLNRLNAMLSLLHPLDRYRTPSAIGSAIGSPLSRPISHPNTGESPQPPRSQPLGGLNRAIVSEAPFKTSTKQKRDRGRDSQPRPRPRLNSQPQGATKVVHSVSFRIHQMLPGEAIEAFLP